MHINILNLSFVFIGLNISGQLQMKISQNTESSTQVEVTTEDGSVIVMELMAEDEGDDVAETFKMNESGELNIFPCPVCPKSFSRRIQLKRHASVHMEQRGLYIYEIYTSDGNKLFTQLI